PTAIFMSGRFLLRSASAWRKRRLFVEPDPGGLAGRRQLQPWNSELVREQRKNSGYYQQSKQNTEDQRNNWMSTRLEPFRSGALLRRPDAQQQEKVSHWLTPRFTPIGLLRVRNQCQQLAGSPPRSRCRRAVRFSAPWC